MIPRGLNQLNHMFVEYTAFQYSLCNIHFNIVQKFTLDVNNRATKGELLKTYANPYSSY